MSSAMLQSLLIGDLVRTVHRLSLVKTEIPQHVKTDDSNFRTAGVGPMKTTTSNL